MSDKVFYKVLSVLEGDQVKKSQYKLLHRVGLKGYKRCQVRNELYPAAIKSMQDSIEGVLIYGLSSKDIKYLDDFEGDEYERVSITVDDSDGNSIDAEFYEWTAGEEHLNIGNDWELDAFKIDEFLKTFY